MSLIPKGSFRVIAYRSDERTRHQKAPNYSLKLQLILYPNLGTLSSNFLFFAKKELQLSLQPLSLEFYLASSFFLQTITAAMPKLLSTIKEINSTAEKLSPVSGVTGTSSAIFTSLDLPVSEAGSFS